jgi:signal transduction histidine kinase
LILLRLASRQTLIKFQSGRVIALGRVMLSALFLLAIGLDRSQPAYPAPQTYTLLAFYLLYAVAVAALTWRNWWLDARLAAPAHAIDMAIFTAIVFSTNGYTSPFFLFFVLPLLSAAIRWGWVETALTAAALVVLYLAGGLLVAGTQTFEMQRFVVRSGHLVILSALLMWFGNHQRHTRAFFRLDEFNSRFGSNEEPFGLALGVALQVTGARCGALLVSDSGGAFSGLRVDPAGVSRVSLDRAPARDSIAPVFLFDRARDRALARLPERRFRFARASSLLEPAAIAALGLTVGLAAEVSTGTAAGWILLWDVPDLSTDFLDVGAELGNAAGAVLDRHALLRAIEEGAAAGTRLSLARDVHDSLVQFLAGAAFRIEAIARSARAGGAIDGDLQELKRLLVEEQAEIRGFVSALRRERELDLGEAVEELRVLAERLSQQWSVKCHVSDGGDHGSVPIRLLLDLQHLLREAVANAVRHGGADCIDVAVSVGADELRMEVRDNGSGFETANGQASVEPWSLKERIDRARGSLRLVSAPGSTNITITLPLTGATA